VCVEQERKNLLLLLARIEKVKVKKRGNQFSYGMTRVSLFFIHRWNLNDESGRRELCGRKENHAMRSPALGRAQ
jgi:hypothetical protein